MIITAFSVLGLFAGWAFCHVGWWCPGSRLECLLVLLGMGLCEIKLIKTLAQKYHFLELLRLDGNRFSFFSFGFVVGAFIVAHPSALW